MNGLGFVLGGLLLVAASVGTTEVVAADAETWLGVEEFGVAVDSMQVAAGTRILELSRAPLDTVLAVIVSGEDLRADPDLRVLRESGKVVLPRALSTAAAVEVHYRIDPTRLPPYIALRERVTSPEGFADSIAVAEPVPLSVPDTTDGLGALRIEGSKTVAVRSGSNRDASVDQGLNLSIHGQLTEGIAVRAEISDENLPITPEGNTEELADLDQVSIELYGERGRVLIGDFRVDGRLGVFVPYERKLQGLDLIARDPRGRVEVLGGSPRGRRREVELRGREGVQGPYELLDGRRLDQTFIVAGSERVVLDGRELTRGSDRDYTIDYIRGTITFTSRQPIVPQSRIAVDFETSVAGYQRNVVGAIVDSVAVGPLRFEAAVLREGDDAQRPKDRSLEDEELLALEAAGDDPQAARSAGVRATEPGEGDYLERFDGAQRYFVAADSTGGDFDVDFLFVGAGQGEYVLRGVNETGVLDFEYRGPGGGDYTVGRLLPLPEVTDVAVVGLGVGDRARGAFARAEVNLTRHDANRLSELDDGDNDGAAWRVEAASPRWFASEEPDDGLVLSALAERIDARFEGLGRLRAPFFYEAWNLQSDQRAVDEDHREARLRFARDGRRTEMVLRSLERSGAYRGRRVEARGGGPIGGGLHWRHLFAETAADRLDAGSKSHRRDRSLRIHFDRYRVAPFVQVQDEVFTDARTQRSTGYREGGWSAGLQFGTRGLVSIARDNADSISADGRAWRFARDAWSARARGGLGRDRTRLDLDLSWRRAELPDDAVETTRLARAQLAHRAPERGISVDLDYRLGTDQSRVLGRQIVFVGFGKGDYDVEGNVLGPGKGDYDLIYTPTDSLVASTEVQLDARVEVRPDHDFLWGWGQTLDYTISERSRSDEVGRLMRLDPDVLRRADTTVFGEQRLREEVLLLRNLRRFDLRIGHERQDLLDQRFREGPQETRRRRSDLRLESRLTGGWSLRTDIGREDRRRRTTNESNPLLADYDVRDRTAAGSLRWRASQRWRAELELRYTRREERDTILVQDVWAVAPQLTAAALSARWTLDARWAEVREEAAGGERRPFFFERPGSGRSAGILAQWGGTGSLTVNLRYQITDEPGRDVRQDLSFETRARF